MAPDNDIDARDEQLGEQSTITSEVTVSQGDAATPSPEASDEGTASTGPEPAPIDPARTEESPAETTPSETAPVEQTSGEDSPAGAAPAEETPVDEPAVEQAPSSEATTTGTPAGPAANDTPGTEETAPAEPASVEETPAPAKKATRTRKTTTKRAPRKATAKATAPAAAPAPEAVSAPGGEGQDETPESMVGTPTSDTDAGDAQEAADALASVEPARRAPRKAAKRTRRATAKAGTPAVPVDAAPGPDADETAVPAPVEAEDVTTETPVTEAPAAEDGAPRADRAAEAEALAAAAEIDADESDDEITDMAVAVLDDDTLDDLIAKIPATPAEDEAPAASASPFGLLFQAPDPTTARRHRRATSPSVDPSTVQRDEDDQELTEDAEQDERPESSDETEERSPRRRRRGGKGRRRGSEPEDSDEADEVGPSPEQEPEAEDDASDDDGDGDEESSGGSRRSRRRRGRKSRSERSQEDSGSDGDGSDDGDDDSGSDQGSDHDDDSNGSSTRRRRRRRRSGSGGGEDDPPGTVTKVRESRRSEATGIKGSTRLEAKKQRRREGREAGRRRTIITEAEFLARRESVERTMVVRDSGDRTQIAVLEDGVLVEHYVSRQQSASSTSIAGNIYLGRVQNVLPSMEAAFVDIGKGRNAVLYAGEVNWDAAGLENGQARRIENALRSGDTVLVQATKDPIGHKGARLTSQISLPGRYLVFVPGSSMTGISRKLPDTERSRLKKILKEVMPADAGVIVRTAAEGASEEELRADVARLTKTWEDIQAKAKAPRTHAPSLLHGEPDLTVRVIRDVFNEDFSSLVVSGESVWQTVSSYVESVAPDLAPRLQRWTGEKDVFAGHRIDEQLAKAMDRKVWLPSGGSLVIDRTEAMTVIDVNTGKFVGQGGNLEETVTKNNIEAAEEIVRQLRLRDIGGIIVVDFIDMVLESNRDLVVRRLVECLGRDRTKHQVAEVTSLGLVQMTRKRVGTGLIESFSTTCEHCNGRGILISSTPVAPGTESGVDHSDDRGGRRGRKAKGSGSGGSASGSTGGAGRGPVKGCAQETRPSDEATDPDGPTPAQIAAAAHAAAMAASKAVTDDETPASPDEVARAIDEAMTNALGAEAMHASSAPTEPSEVGEPAEPAKGRRSGRRSARSPEQAPSAGQPAGPVTAPAPSVAHDEETEEPVVMPAVPLVEEQEQERPRRRRRGRVVAPAGPPRPVETSSTDE